MLDACLASRTHYFDITGEIDVFENAHSKRINGAARQAGIVVCPGIGFDVVPTDCIARALADALPDASDLALGFQGDMNVSPGNAKTIVERLGDGTFARHVLDRIRLIPERTFPSEKEKAVAGLLTSVERDGGSLTADQRERARQP